MSGKDYMRYLIHSMEKVMMRETLNLMGGSIEGR
jgi:hypothetical protein